MINLSFLAISFIVHVVATIWVICALGLILIVLVQKGRGGGLSSAFGGGGGASGVLGTKTGDFLTWVTIVLVGIFLLFSVVLAKYYKPTISDFGQDQQQQQGVPATDSAGQQSPLTGGSSGDTGSDRN